MGRVTIIVKNRLGRYKPISRAALNGAFAAVRVTVKGREVRTGNLHPQPVSGFKDIGRGANQNFIFVNPPRFNQGRLLQRPG